MQRPVTYTQQVAAGLFAVLAASCGSHPPHAPPNGNDQGSASSGPQCKSWQFADAAPQDPRFQLAAFVGGGGGCDSDQCGLNGMWFGQGVGFREIHLGHTANHEGLQLTGVMAPPRSRAVGRDLSLTIDKDAMALEDQATGAIAVATSDLAGAKLVLTWNGHYVDKLKQTPITFTLEILEVTRPAFWDCPVGARTCDHGFKYRFAAITNADGGCKVEVCDPNLARDTADPDASIAGTAVAFIGDVYGKRADADLDEFKVYSREASPRCAADQLPDGDRDIINFACTGTTLSKLYLMRHTTASRPASRPVPVSQRQAMLRMLTADYCGIGMPFTHNGVPLSFGTRGWGTFAHYDLNAREPLEAIWTDHGAACIGQPRLATEHPYREIVSHCAIAPPTCTAAHPDPALLTPPTAPPSGCDDTSGSYLESALP
jgi:ADYC domain-containing protein